MTHDPETYARVHALLVRCKDLGGPELEAYLARNCAGDGRLRDRVLQLRDAGGDHGVDDPFSERNLRELRQLLERVLED